MELPGVYQPENEVDDDVLLTLFPSEYDSNNEYDEKDKNIDMSTQQGQSVTHPEIAPPTVQNVFNIRLQKQIEYVKEKINLLISLSQVKNE